MRIGSDETGSETGVQNTEFIFGTFAFFSFTFQLIYCKDPLLYFLSNVSIARKMSFFLPNNLFWGKITALL